MTCSKCTRKVHARGMCASHYVAWYRIHRQEITDIKSKRYHPVRKWKFTTDHWRRWWDKRMPDERTVSRREGIQEFRSLLARKRG